MFKKIYSLVMENREGMERISIGRLTFMLAFGFAMYRWCWFWKDIPQTMSVFLVASLGYVVGGKAIETVKAFAKPKGNAPQGEP